MKAHWTTRDRGAFLFKVLDDFTVQLEKKMDSLNMTRGKLAKRLNVSKGRVSQVMNNPGNISLRVAITYARSLGMKVALIAYEDGDPKNLKGPINAEIFANCWDKCGKPRDNWEMASFQQLLPADAEGHLLPEEAGLPDIFISRRRTLIMVEETTFSGSMTTHGPNANRCALPFESKPIAQEA
jgi:transcriptional regulator with XRE-family HTH domain